MKKMINKAHVEGRISECSLEIKVSKKGITYIGGRIDVATDNEGLNVVTVDFPYVAEKYANGKDNGNYKVLYPLAVKKDDAGNIVKTSQAITLMGNPGEAATMVKIDPAVDLNEWYKEENKEDVLVSSKKLSGGFIHVVDKIVEDEPSRNRFETDMVITGTSYFEADEEKNTPEKLIVKGCIFNFRNEILPVEYSVLNPQGIEIFEAMSATKNTPVFTKVWGKIINETIVKTTTEESAFGEAVVKETTTSKRDWVLTGASVAPYEFDVEGSITAKELEEGIANRQVMLAEKLREHKERQAEKNKGNGTFTAAPTTGGFAF